MVEGDAVGLALLVQAERFSRRRGGNQRGEQADGAQPVSGVTEQGQDDSSSWPTRTASTSQLAPWRTPLAVEPSNSASPWRP